MHEVYRIEIREVRIPVTDARHTFFVLSKSVDGSAYQDVAHLHGMPSPENSSDEFIPISEHGRRPHPYSCILRVFEVSGNSADPRHRTLFEFAAANRNLDRACYEFSPTQTLARWESMRAGAQIINGLSLTYDPSDQRPWPFTVNSNSVTFLLALLLSPEPQIGEKVFRTVINTMTQQ